MLSSKQDSCLHLNLGRIFVSIAFDDGRYEQYDKYYPVLVEYGLKGTFYVVTERIGWKGVMGWDELDFLH